MNKVFVPQKEFERIVKENIESFDYLTNQNESEKFSGMTKKLLDEGVKECFMVGDTIYAVAKDIPNLYNFDNFLSKEEMDEFIINLKVMYDRTDNPYGYGFDKVLLTFEQIFKKGEFHPEDVKNQLFEIIPEMFQVFINTFSGGSYGPDDFCDQNSASKCLIFIASRNKVTRENMLKLSNELKLFVNRPKFELDKSKLEELTATEDFKFVERLLSVFLSGLECRDNIITVDKDLLVLLISHIILNSNLEISCGNFKEELEQLLSTYRKIFNVGTFPSTADVSEYNNKLSLYVCNYNNWISHERDVKDPTKIIKDKIYSGWYESGYILGSPEGQKLF